MLTRVERRSSGPTGDSGEGGATGSKTGGSYARDERRDKLTTEDEIRMDDLDEHAIDQVRGWQW